MPHGMVFLCSMVWIFMFVKMAYQYEQNGFYQRDKTKHFHYANFKKYLDRTLNVSFTTASIHVNDSFDCAFKCLRNTMCFSFNFAIAPEVDGHYLCQLLATDKYNHSESFVLSKEFHHYGIVSPCDNSPCQNGCKCRALYEKNDYKCDCFFVNDQVVARGTNNVYHSGIVESIGNEQIKVLFDNGNRITHTTRDISGVVLNKARGEPQRGQHVLAQKKGSGPGFHIGFVIEKDASSGFKVTFDDNPDADYYTSRELLLFPDHLSPREVGARVFARYTNGLYYRGFVTSATPSSVHITYDDGDTIDLQKDDIGAVILDKLPSYSGVHVGQRVIGYWPGRIQYYPGEVTEVKDCCYVDVYHVMLDNGDQRDEDFNQIRLIPS